jgi:hypothetical protein
VDPIQQIAMLGTFREVFLLEAFFAGTFDKVSDFEIIFEIIFFFGHGRRPFFASINCFFLKTLDIQPFWQMPSPLVPGWDKTLP